jgi:hypothetical protein
MTSPGVTLWIPGPWKNRTEFITAIAATDTGVLAAGGKLFDAANKRHAGFDVLERNGYITKEMYIGSGRSFDRETLEAIDDHNSIAVVTVTDTGPGLEQRLDAFTRAVRSAGGIAVKVHKSGLSHDWARWESELKSAMPAGLFRLLVVQVRDPDVDQLSSFGMHQFALPDGSIADTGGDVEAAWALFEFNAYLWDRQPQLQDGHTFSRAGDGAIKYRLSHAVDRRYPEGHPYLNPHGIWEMKPA